MNKKGFTLVELLVVIAIIGILSSVAVVNLNSARDKAKFAATQAAVSQMSTPIILCGDENPPSSLNQPDPAGGNAVCPAYTDTDWPNLPTGNGFQYDDLVDGDSSDMTWEFSVTNSTTSETIICTENGCS